MLHLAKSGFGLRRERSRSASLTAKPNGESENRPGMIAPKACLSEGILWIGK
jgi:hypothetical protein